MDYSTIIVAVLALAGTLAGSFLSNNKNTALIAYRLEELEKKVEQHNHVVERLSVVERDLKTAYARIDESKEMIKMLKEEISNELD